MRFAVIGASHGTGRAIVDQLATAGHRVRAISRHPPAATASIDPVAADVTDAAALEKALTGAVDAIFYTVDIHGLFNTRAKVRGVMVDGCANALAAAKRHAPDARFVLLSVIGPDKPSWVWWLLNTVKPGMRKNILEREAIVKASGQAHVICRAPKLADGPGGTSPAAATPPQHRLSLRMTIDRADLARAMIAAARKAPEGTTWDIFISDEGPTPSWLGDRQTG